MAMNYFNHPRRFPKNAAGPFYTTGEPYRETDDPASPIVWGGDCLWCGAPEAEATSLLAPFDETYTDTYFVRQPATAEETDQAISAARVCCVSAIRYGGRDPNIIARLDNDPAMCDFVVSETGE